MNQFILLYLNNEKHNNSDKKTVFLLKLKKKTWYPYVETKIKNFSRTLLFILGTSGTTSPGTCTTLRV